MAKGTRKPRGKQTFVVTLETFWPFDQVFPKVEAEWMALAIRDAIQAKSCSFLGPAPFRISVGRMEEESQASGRVPEYSPEEFDEAQETSPSKALEPRSKNQVAGLVKGSHIQEL